jgi:hypothetical protein
VEKSPQLRQNRDQIEALHEVIGFEIHSRAESDSAKASLSHEQLVDIVQEWLVKQGKKKNLARELFRLGEERLGLVVVLKGDGEDARYGFEVQPVREYFAAAFINDKCEGNAHDFFQAMVRRPFWHEVALFLAGLRRANEKADLLSRARALDDEPENGWRSDGLRIVLQLLQEGVLTSPGHVHQDALSFLVEALDPAGVKARNEPREMVSVLPALIRSCENAQIQGMLEELLRKSANNQDRYALWRLYTVANSVLPCRELEKHVSTFNDSNGKLSSLVKLYWPAQAGKSFKNQVVPTEWAANWAATLFSAATVLPALTEVQGTVDFHNYLFEQFAFRPIFNARFTRNMSAFSPAGPHAIWRLCANLQSISLRN